MAAGVKTNIGIFAERFNLLSSELAACSELVAEALWEWAPVQVMENFDRGQSAWEPLKPQTLEQRARRGNPGTNILEDTLALEGSLVNSRKDAIQIIDANTVSYGTSIPYASIHQYGLPVRNIPKRPFMPDRNQMAGFVAVMQAKINTLVSGIVLGVKGAAKPVRVRTSAPVRVMRRAKGRSMKRAVREAKRRAKQTKGK